MPLQDWIYNLEEGTGSKVIKMAVAVMGFVALAGLFDALAYQSFPNEEAMETAQLARNLSRGKGFTTQTIRPLSIYLLRMQAPPGQAAGVLSRPAPDLSTPSTATIRSIQRGSAIATICSGPTPCAIR